MILRWAPLPGADIASYKVYRSIIGFHTNLPTPATVAGKTLQLKMNGGSLQTITFSGSASLVDQINAVLLGGRAYLSYDTVSFLLRSDIRCGDGKVEIVGGTALGDLNLTVRTITEKSEDELLATVPAPVDPDAVVEYEDPDGVLGDWYAISVVNSMSQESTKTPWRQPITASGPLCIVEGLVITLQGARIPDAKVIATVQVPPESTEVISSISTQPVETLTGPDGRFSLPLLQCALVRLEIEAIGLSRMITIPEKSFVYLNDIRVDLDYRLIP